MIKMVTLAMLAGWRKSMFLSPSLFFSSFFLFFLFCPPPPSFPSFFISHGYGKFAQREAKSFMFKPQWLLLVIPLMAYSAQCLLQKAVECPLALSLHRSLYRAGGMSLIQTHLSAMDA